MTYIYLFGNVMLDVLDTVIILRRLYIGFLSVYYNSSLMETNSICAVFCLCPRENVLWNKKNTDDILQCSRYIPLVVELEFRNQLYT